MLLDEIYLNENKEIMDRIIEFRDDRQKTRELIRELSEISSEDKRMGKLATTYTNNVSSGIDFKNSWIVLLDALPLDEAFAFQKQIYQVRNFIFHNFRNFPDDAYPALSASIEELLICLPEVLSKFSLVNLDGDTGDQVVTN